MQMAASNKDRVPFRVLHNLSSVDILYDEVRKKKMRRTQTVGVFEAERLIARRKNTEGYQYLVKWKGYSSFENTWEPEHHISRASLRYFEDPEPPVDVVQECVDRLRREVIDALKHKWPEQRLTIEFRHDVYQFLFGGKGKAAEQKNWTLYQEQDFSDCQLPQNWNSHFDQHGDGVKMRFPIKMRKFLGRSRKSFRKEGERIVETPRAYTEKISVNFIKIPSSCC